MTIFELGALGEFIGAIAVVLTLIYIAVQVKHGKESMDANTVALEENRKLVRADMERHLIQQFDAVNYQLAETLEISSIVLRGYQNPDDLKPEERYLFFTRVLARINFFMSALRLARDGFVSEEYTMVINKNMPMLLSSSTGMATVWNEVKHSYPTEFVEHVDKLIEESGADEATISEKWLGKPTK